MTTTPKMPKSIAIGLARAQIYARGVDKKGRNTVGAGYNYATSEDIIAEARKALMEGGRLVFAVSGWSFRPRTEEREAKTKEYGGKTTVLAMAVGRITIRYRLICLDDGEEHCDETEAPVVPDFGRPDDKAEFGALTEGHAYTLRGLLNLPRGVEGAIDMNQCAGEYTIPATNEPPATREEPPPAPSPAREPTRAPAPSIAQAATAQAPRPAAAPAAMGTPQEIALFEELIRKAQDSRSDPAAMCEAIGNAALPAPLRRRAFARLFERAIPRSATLDDLCSWIDWVRAEIPADSDERAALRPIVEQAVERLGWTLDAQARWEAPPQAA